MVTQGAPADADVRTAERNLAMSYAPAEHRAALAALLDLDATLGGIVRAVRDPLVGQMRLTWWFDALSALDTAPPPAQPVLQVLAVEVLTRGVSGAALAGMIDGWEALLDADAIGDERLDVFAQARGAMLFVLAGRVLGASDGVPLGPAGAGWALSDLARHLSDPKAATRARELARAALDPALALRWSRASRALGALAHLARMDLSDPPSRPGAPGRVARLAWHRLSGR